MLIITFNQNVAIFKTSVIFSRNILIQRTNYCNKNIIFSQVIFQDLAMFFYRNLRLMIGKLDT